MIITFWKQRWIAAGGGSEIVQIVMVPSILESQEALRIEGTITKLTIADGGGETSISDVYLEHTESLNPSNPK